ncbi:HAD family hydrolase [Actinokineospora fastidiosa]|uniref:HAD family hydrolase n=1 Tax=Actinokineospora fastidiosa TaxID=1816 RepID=UPI001E3FA8FA|nr:HAD family hydrolase [Actinokineospora fastidiosa]
MTSARSSFAALTHVSMPAALPPTIHAICLDVDDTVIDFTGSARMALSELTGRDDLWPAWLEITEDHSARAIAGEFDHDTMRRVRTKAFLDAQGADFDEATVAVLEDRRRDRMTRLNRAFPDAAPTLDWLRAAGFRIAAVTNASHPDQHARLARVGLARFFDAVISAGALGVAKPDPAIFHAACAELDVLPEHTMHVGDRIDLDARAAADAGLHGVWLDRAARPGPVEPGIHVIDSLSDLPTLLVTEFRTPTVTTSGGVPAQRG